VRENDKILTINGKTPRNVDDAVAVIKAAGNQIKLVVMREEDVPDVHVSDGEQDPNWVSAENVTSFCTLFVNYTRYIRIRRDWCRSLLAYAFFA